MVTFNKNIFIVGCGAVSQCTLPLLFKLLDISPNQVTVMDFVDNKERIKEFLDKGVTYVQKQITPENYATLLKQYLKPGDLFLDLAWNIDTCTLLDWCHENGVMYLNTSVELWEPYKNVSATTPDQLTLYHRQMEILKLFKKWGKKETTAIVDHGANPGLVSHFTKQALIEIATKIIKEKPTDRRIKDLQESITSKNFAKLGFLTGTKVIHISERDTQITNKPKEVNEFVNTWSVEGLLEEGMAPAELGWGTHEKIMHQRAFEHTVGPKNQIFLSTRGIDTWVRSWVPSGPIIGMVIRHGEAYGISERLTLWHSNKPMYRPTVHYAYCPSDCTLNSLHEFRMHNFVPQKNQRIMNDEIIRGNDELGCLLMGHDFNSWWIGSILSIEEARRLVPHQNATTLQVAVSIVAAAIHAIKNPNLGVCLPDDIDHEEILRVAKPFLGNFVSTPSDWTPLSGPNNYLVFGKDIPSKDDMWQFSSFLVKKNFYK